MYIKITGIWSYVPWVAEWTMSKYPLPLYTDGLLGWPRPAETGNTLTWCPRTVRKRIFNNYISDSLRKICQFNKFTYGRVLRCISSVFMNSNHELSSYPWRYTNLSRNLTSGSLLRRFQVALLMMRVTHVVNSYHPNSDAPAFAVWSSAHNPTKFGRRKTNSESLNVE